MAIPKYSITAHAQEIDGEFFVLAGSQARDHWASASSYASYQALYQQLRDDGILVTDEAGKVSFVQDQSFSSPSAAAAVVSGRPANGRTTWTVQNSGQTYGQWQDAQVSQEAGD